MDRQKDGGFIRLARHVLEFVGILFPVVGMGTQADHWHLFKFLYGHIWHYMYLSCILLKMTGLLNAGLISSCIILAAELHVEEKFSLFTDIFIFCFNKQNRLDPEVT